MSKLDKSDCTHCIENYIRNEYQGKELIGISNLADYCKTSEGEVYIALVKLKQQKAVEIVKRYHYPQAHLISFEEDFCFEDFVVTSIYIKPLKIDKKPT